MLKFKKSITLCILSIFILSLLAGPALAKGAKGGFSGGGRKSFSSSAKGYSSSSKSGGFFSDFSQGSKPSGSASGDGAVKTTPSAPADSPGGGTSSYGKGYTTSEGGGFSTPRQNSPPTLYSDYNTGKQGYSTGKTSYGTGTGSYSGSWNRETYSTGGLDKYPSKSPVGIFGSPPRPPYYYHNYYWGLPWLAHLFFQPNYYYTPWGYHFFAPRLLSWIILLFVVGGVIIFIKNKRFLRHN